MQTNLAKKNIVQNLINKDIVFSDVKIKEQLKLGQAQEHLKLLHESDDGFITICMKKDDTWSQYHEKYKKLNNHLYKFIDLDNVYISQNSFYIPFRKLETIRSLNALYIDLDYYNINLYKDLKPSQMIGILELDVFNRIVPEPNFVISSGRGLSIVFLLKPAASVVLPLWNVLQNYLYEQFEAYGADPKSLDATRVLRLASTKNNKSNKEVKLYVYPENINYKYELSELAENYLPEYKPRKRKRTGKKENKTNKIKYIYNVFSLHYARFMDLLKLQELRCGYSKKEGVIRPDGNREMMCFLYRYWSNFYLKDDELALQNTLEFNKKFAVPLSEREVKKQTQNAEKAYLEWLKDKPNGKYFRGGYNYSNEKLIRILEISEEEQKHLKTIISKEEAYRRKYEKRKEKRRDKDGFTKREKEKINKVNAVKELVDKGLKKTEIAKELGVSRQMVYKYLYELQKV